jgi:cytochrome oxidase Cu insertion factor (SCO1/SenC/PrrC family)
MKRRLTNPFLILVFLTFAKPTTSQMQTNRVILNGNSGYSYLSGQLDFDNESDTLTLFCTGQFYSDVPYLIEKEAKFSLTTIARKGKFIFKIPVMSGPFHINLYTSSTREPLFFNIAAAPKLHYFLLEPGDSIHINFNRDSLKFSGKDAALFQLQYQIEKQEKLIRLVGSDFNKAPKRWLAIEDSILNEHLELLFDYKTQISPLSFTILKADIIGKNRKWVYERIEIANFNPDLFWGKGALTLFEELEKRPDTYAVSGSALLAPVYVEYQYQKLLVEYKYDRHMISLPMDLDLSSIITTKYDGALRDKLLTRWLKTMIKRSCAHPEYFEDALSVMNTSFYKQIVEDWKKNYAKGEPVLNFAFKDSLDNTVRLSDFRGKVIFMDMWFTECLSCVEVSRCLKAVEEEFKNDPKVVFISISIDRDKKKWLKSINSNTPDDIHHAHHYINSTTKYLYTGGKGFNDEFIMKYNPNGSYPQLLLLDKQGKIFSADPPRPDFENGKEKLIAKIKEALKSI